MPIFSKKFRTPVNFIPHYKNSVLFGIGKLVRFFSHSAVLSFPQKPHLGKYSLYWPITKTLRPSVEPVEPLIPDFGSPIGPMDSFDVHPYSNFGYNLNTSFAEAN